MSIRLFLIYKYCLTWILYLQHLLVKSFKCCCGEDILRLPLKQGIQLFGPHVAIFRLQV